ncbi:uncharacterized protein [Amphiura filiformis]|uniref:uncharacterized protein n=1 Tax=Amphiura filiformis TaxID=82378 RepID=UPI003B224EB9
MATLSVQRKENDKDRIDVSIAHIMKELLPQPNPQELQGAAGKQKVESSDSNNNCTKKEKDLAVTNKDMNPSSSGKSTHQTFKMFQLILDDAMEDLYNNLNPINIVLRLQNRQVLTDDEVAQINRISGLGERVKILLAILKTKDVHAYDEFISALREFDHDLFRAVKIIERRYPGRV